jgi:hypothetical protein
MRNYLLQQEPTIAKKGRLMILRFLSVKRSLSTMQTESPYPNGAHMAFDTQDNDKLLGFCNH